MDKSKWEYKKLGEVAKFINGDRGVNYPSQSDFVEVGVPFVNAGHLKNNAIDFSSMNYITREKFDKLGSGKIQKGDLLFCLRGSLGKKAIVDNIEEGAIASSLVILRPSAINTRFLSYYLESPLINDEIERSNNGSSQPNLSARSVSQFLIPIPEVADQQRIVAELDCLNEMIALKQEQLKEFDKLAQSIFYDMFGDPVENERGWKMCFLKDATTNITDGDHMPPPKSETGVPFVTISNVDKETHQIDFSDTFFVPKEYYDAIPDSKKPQVGDVLYTVTGSYGIPVLLKEKKEFCFQRHIGLIRPGCEIEPVFLCLWAECKPVKEYADRVATGVAQKTVSLKALRNFPIILPPLALQQQFAEKIQAIEAQKKLVKKSIAETQHLLDSRMDLYFD